MSKFQMHNIYDVKLFFYIFEKFLKILLTKKRLTIIIYELAIGPPNVPTNARACWNWQTGTFEGRVSMTCGFKSHCSHQNIA